MHFTRFMTSKPLFTALAALGCLGAAPTAHALAAVPTLSTFTFSGGCGDCTLDAPPMIGTLVLQDYTPGTAIDFSHFVSFSYRGSDLVYRYSVTLTGDDGNAATLDYTLMPATSDFISGNLPAAPGNARFMLGWEDGLGFQTATDGQWFTCARGPAGYSSGSCTVVINNDIGSGSWSTTPVPEPANALLLTLGLLGLGAVARRQRR